MVDLAVNNRIDVGQAIELEKDSVQAERKFGKGRKCETSMMLSELQFFVLGSKINYALGQKSYRHPYKSSVSIKNKI